MTHLKRASMPIFWPVSRKGAKYTTSPDSGPHPVKACMPLRVLLRDVLRYAETAREADKIIKQGVVSVDGKPRKGPGFPVGLMDSVDLGEGGCFRVMPDAGGFSLVGIKKSEAGRKPCRITGKRTLKGGAIQINLHDGRSVLVKDGKYRPGDTIILEVPKQRIAEHKRFKEGEKAIVIDGNNRGAVGKISGIRERKTMTEMAGVILDVDGRTVTTLKEYVMVGSFPVPPRFAQRMAEEKEKAKKVKEKPKEVKKEIKKPEKKVEKKEVKKVKEVKKKTEKKAVKKPVKKTAKPKAKKAKKGVKPAKTGLPPTNKPPSRQNRHPTLRKPKRPTDQQPPHPPKACRWEGQSVGGSDSYGGRGNWLVGRKTEAGSEAGSSKPTKGKAGSEERRGGRK